VASAWLVATYSLYIRARQFDSLWWSQRREVLKTVKRSLHGGRYEIFSVAVTATSRTGGLGCNLTGFGCCLPICHWKTAVG
jgi:hypothetical protein